MRALDTNVLVHATIQSSADHGVARRVLSEAAEGAAPWALAWPCLYEWLRVVTHLRVFHPPMPVEAALADLRDRKSTRLNSSHIQKSRMPSSA